MRTDGIPTSLALVLALVTSVLCLSCQAARVPPHTPPTPAALTHDGTAAIAAHDGSHDFDFLIGDWKAHVRRLPERLVGSNKWVTYDGISNHKKLLGSNANLEEFEVDSPETHLHIRGQLAGTGGIDRIALPRIGAGLGGR